MDLLRHYQSYPFTCFAVIKADELATKDAPERHTPVEVIATGPIPVLVAEVDLELLPWEQFQALEGGPSCPLHQSYQAKWRCNRLFLFNRGLNIVQVLQEGLLRHALEQKPHWDRQ